MFPARLWQDPFQVLDVAESKGESCSIADTPKFASDAKICAQPFVLFVLADHSRYEDTAEIRRRSRIAVISGLARRGYLPVDSERIGVARYAENWTTAEGTAECVSFCLPFEWYHFNGENSNPDGDALPEIFPAAAGLPKDLVVFWLREDMVKKYGFELLGRVVQMVSPESAKSSSECSRAAAIGPTTSNVLLSLLQILKRDPPDQAHPEASSHGQTGEVLAGIVRRMIILNARATAEERILLRAIERADASIAEFFRVRSETTPAPRYVRVTNGDDDLCRTIIDELQRRDLNLQNGKSEIILISEFDTFYGQVVQESFRKAFEERLKGCAGLERNPSRESQRRIRQYSYLRGLDGALPSERAEDKSAPADALADVQKSPFFGLPVGFKESPVGRGQQDYVRRLVDRIARETASGKRQEVAAIGVVGSDLYDKQIILKAARKQFPNATFFTTDLEAFYATSSEYSWSRNLVVVSAYGLALSSDLQEFVAPFRDTYQTGQFLATVLALGESDGKEIAGMMNGRPVALVNLIAEPRTFEIARQGAIDISPQRFSRGEENVLHPTALSIRWIGGMVVPLVSACAYVFLLCLLYSDSMKRSLLGQADKKDVYQDWRFIVIILSALLLFVLTAAAWMFDGNGDEEPLYFFNGISAWPAQFIRLISIALSCLYIGESLRQATKAHDSVKVANKEALGWVPRHGSDYDPTHSHPFGSLFLRYIGMEKLANVTLQQNATTWDIWQRNLLGLEWRTRCYRVLVITAAYFILAGVFVHFGQRPYSPVRGGYSQFIDVVFNFASIGLFLYLSFLIVDVLVVCGMYLRAMNRCNVRNGTPQLSEDALWVAYPDLITKKGHLIRNKQRIDEARLEMRNALISAMDRQWLIRLKLAARITKYVNRSTTYPFIILLLLVISRFSGFDNWGWPWTLTVVAVLQIGMILFGSALLRRAAERMRADCLEYIDSRPGDAPHMELSTKFVKDLTTGAFGPWTQQPAVRGVLIPFGGAGAVALLDFLVVLGM